MIESPMKGEEERCSLAVEEALRGRTVAIVCGGDPGVYEWRGWYWGRHRDMMSFASRWCRA